MKSEQISSLSKGFNTVKSLFFVLIFIFLVSSCGPVNTLTRLKRTPREYSLNYCYSDIRAPKSNLNKETWIVFSDRDNNDTYQHPGGKVKLKRMSFMEAFFVIREKGDFLQLVKYDTEVIAGNPQARIMKNRKKAEYYGWVRRSNMLLTKQSSIDMATGFKNKAITMVSDSLAVSVPQLFFDTDSVLAFKDENMTLPSCKVPIHEILYILKSSADGKKILVSRKTQLNPQEAVSEVPGWISSSIVKEVGQRLFVDAESIENALPVDKPVFLDRCNENEITLEAVELRDINKYSRNNPEFRYAPVRSYRTDSAQIYFHTAFPAPLINKERNYVLNLNGNKIMYNDFLRLEENLRKMNIIFVFEGRERLLQEYPRLMSVIQNLQPFFNIENDPYQYKFGAVLTYRDNNQSMSLQTKTHDLSEDFTKVLDFLTAEMDSISGYYPIANNQAWSGLYKAVEMMEIHPEETHLLIVIGESGYTSEKADSILAKRIATANGRVLGYQIFNEKLSNEDNNFVLQIENLIEKYTQYDMSMRRERLVYTSQYKPEVRYRESVRNVYALDPQKSMTQGWILFPAKTEDMQLDILTQSIDTLIMETRQDNDAVIEHIDRAFNEFGDRFYRFTNSWTTYNGKDSLWNINRELLHRMPRNLPAWFLPSKTISIAKDDTVDYHLLLSESELKEIRTFLEDLTMYEPDFKYKGKRIKVKRCNCPDDNLIVNEVQQDEHIYDKNGDPVYFNTRSIRWHLYQSFMTRLKTSYKISTVRRCRLKYQSLAIAELEIVGNPVKEDMVKKFIIKDLKRKKKMKDVELDRLILYYKQKQAALENYLYKQGNIAFVSNGESYYWIDRDLLP